MTDRKPRPPIASRDPEIQALWAQGLRKTEILRRLGLRCPTVNVFGFPDRHQPPAPALPGETPETRAFRRFPINTHKPGDMR